MLRSTRFLHVASSLVVAALGFACSNSPLSASLPANFLGHRAPERAIWVSRFDYKTRDDVITIVGHCKAAGFNTILFQVRGNATASYPSSLEPWSEMLGGADPGFDPLQTAIERAHAEGIRLAAWVNVMPAWWGKEPPKDPNQVVNKHPDWLWYDQKGQRQPYSNKFYVSLNPCLPEVRHHIVDVLRDLAGRYDIDELHLDYMRFPNEQPAGEPDRSALDYPRDARTVALFQAESGKKPDQDKAAWNKWRSEQVSNLLRDIRHALRETKSDLELSVAVGAEPEAALSHFQDYRTWIAEDLVDVVYPMNYAREPKTFDARVQSWLTLGKGTSVVMGVSFEPGDVDLVVQQLQGADRAFHNWALFSYAMLYDSTNTAIASQDADQKSQRQEKRKALLPRLRELVQGGSEP